MSSFWKNKPLEKVIRHPIRYHSISKGIISPGERLQIQEANDQFFVKNVSSTMLNAKIAFFGGLGINFFITLVSFSSEKNKFLINFFIGLSPFLLVCLIFLIMHYMAPVKEIVLDRLNGKISYPRLFGNKEHRTIQFDSLHVFETMTTSGDFAVTGKEIRIRDRKYDYSWSLESRYPEEYWSFMVWYMDKNRPLPPGTAFDPYRKNDFERRKAEGFPKPLYPSRFETPEATPAQQKERKKIGGW